MSDMSDILERAKKVQADLADGVRITINLGFLQELIAEIERLRALVGDRP